jgi:hypothetical protein
VEKVNSGKNQFIDCSEEDSPFFRTFRKGLQVEKWTNKGCFHITLTVKSDWAELTHVDLIFSA